MEDRKKKEKKYIYVAIVATVSLGTIATVQNLKKKDKVAQQNGTVDVQCKNTEYTV